MNLNAKTAVVPTIGQSQNTLQTSIVVSEARQALKTTSTVLTAASTAAPAEAAVERWIQTINDSLRNSAGWLILTGQNLIKAKEELGHGNWLAMFGAGKLKFSVRTAQRLMEIAANQVLANATSWSYLPPTCSVLNHLSHLNPQALQKGIQEGTIHPAMTLAEAKAFIATVQQKQLPRARQPKPFNPTKRLSRFSRRIFAESERWPVDQRTTLAQALRELADRIAASAA